MWDEIKATRFDQLQKKEAESHLTKTEQGELEALRQARCRHEEEAIEAATRRNEEENARLEAQVQQVQAQNRALEALIREQENYLAEVQSLMAQMETRRRDWQERYRQVTGKPMGQPITREGLP